MNKIYSKDNKKDAFITAHLLPYMLKHIEEGGDWSVRAETADEAASMMIFPYKTAEGVKLGSLKEPGVCWYFVKDEKDTTVSTDSYHIFADHVLKPDQAQKFRQVFGEYDCISEFSNAAVIKDLLEQMSKEEDYTSAWWNYAYDIFKMWDPESFNDSLTKATNNIDNNRFLFCDDYCNQSLKEKLIRYDVFEDVITAEAKKVFWSKLGKSDYDKAIKMLKGMGVPHSFTAAGNVNEYIFKFASEIADSVQFPQDVTDDEYERCELCHTLIMEYLFKESVMEFGRVVQNPDYSQGIVVKNQKGMFLPLSWDLFYSDQDLQKDKKESEENDAEREEDKMEDRCLIYEQLHVDAARYETRMSYFEHIHEFSAVSNTADEYELGIDYEAMDFYQWVWHYSHHIELAENILYYFSEDSDGRETVPEEYNEFVLQVLGDPNVTDAGYCFDIDLQADEAFEHNGVINKVGLCFESVYCVVYSEYTKKDVSNYIPQIVAAISTDADLRSEIFLSPIWEHVYLADGDENSFNDVYVKGKRYENNTYEDALFLWPSDDENSYIRALANYVREKYEVDVDIADAESYDWKAEYARLIRDIRSFVTEKHSVRSVDEIYGYTADMADISDFGDEKRVWSGLKDMRNKILSQETGGIPINMEGWRDFLSAKYKGRCQLCGGKIAMGEQKSYFWTFRMVKESDNKLANLKSNLFCLCPACHGEMRYGNFMGKDMSEIVEKSQKYAKYIEDSIEEGLFEDDFPCLIEEFADEKTEYDGFHNPIVCKVIINGKERNMAFSWEHFMRIAFIFSELNNFTEDDLKENYEDDAEEYVKPVRAEHNQHRYYGNSGNHGHHYEKWHGTEYVSGHWRTRNGQTEWVTGHWRTW